MRDSEGERRIYGILRQSGLPFKEEYVFQDLKSSAGAYLRFDFCVFDAYGRIAFLIEYQGRQHYEPVRRFGGRAGFRRQRYNDAKKRAYCREHGYPLVTIPYWDTDKITYEYILRAAGYE